MLHKTYNYLLYNILYVFISKINAVFFILLMKVNIYIHLIFAFFIPLFYEIRRLLSKRNQLHTARNDDRQIGAFR